MREHKRPVCRFIKTLESRRLRDWARLALSKTESRKPCNGDSCSYPGWPRRRAPRIFLAGCAVGEYSVTMSKCHDIQLSKEAKEELAAGQGKAVIAGGGRLTEAEDEQRREAQKRAVRTTLAKPITPYTDAELALMAQNRDKEAEEKLLASRLADARDRSWQYQKYAI